MKVFYDGDKFTQSVLGKKQVNAGKTYRWSVYAVPHSVDGNDYLYNNFTKKIFLLEGEAFDVQPDKRYSADEINADSNLKLLVEENFILPEEKRESDIYESYCKIARAVKMKRDGYISYTILPTTTCNARCVYCYEQGIEYVTMSDETVAQVIEFIKKTHNRKNPINITWFGGEPLIGEKMIDKICAAMREADIEYGCRMVSNGALITDDIVKKMRDDWKLHHIQITLDGVEEEYNRRKNYYFNYESAYWHVLSRIKKVNEAGIFINIRVNMDSGNIDGVLQMIEDVKAFIPNPEDVSFDLVPLFDLQASENGLEVWDKSFAIADNIMAQGLRVARHHSISKANFHYCMADAPYATIVIAPDGKLYNCENIRSFDSVGDVVNGITNPEYIAKLYEVEPAMEQCKDCVSLPECTTFTRCSHVRVNCKFALRKRMERALDRVIRHYAANAELPDAPEENENEVMDSDINC